MAGEKPQDIWPMPKFLFTLEWAGQTASFQEVTGLDIETQVIEYRSGSSKTFSTVKMPGLKKYGDVTLKKGIFKDSSAVWDLFQWIAKNAIQRQDVTIRLLDETGAATVVWKLKNAWPTKITGTDLKVDDDEVAVESLELAHEGITVET
jgi:phage tail-like protein